MAKFELVRSKLQDKVFSPYGITVDLIQVATPTYNERGELEDSVTTTTPIIFVPYSLLSQERFFQKWGEANEGSTDAAVPYTVSINKQDIILWNSERWVVLDVEDNYLQQNVVKIIRLEKESNS